MYFTQYDVFSFYLDSPTETSFIDFNGFVSSHVKDGNVDRIAWLKMEDDFYWSSYCQGISFGDYRIEENTYKFGTTPIYTIFDTGTSFTLLPASFWSPFT